MVKSIHIGTCSWKYESWKNIVYPENHSKNFLREYANHFNTVEIDQWFWSLFDNRPPVLPNPFLAKEYADSVPDEFIFTVKVPNSITLTHFYRKKKTDSLKSNPNFLSVELFKQFLERIEPLHGKLGPLMFQFEYLNKQKMKSEQQFLDALARFVLEIPRDFQYAVEIRNPNYLNELYFSFLKENNLAHVFLQGYYMPSIFQIYKQFREFIQDYTIIRLHGQGRTDIEKLTRKIWNKIVEPHDDELDKLGAMINDLMQNQISLFLNVNNHYEGSAPLTIQRIQQRIFQG